MFNIRKLYQLLLPVMWAVDPSDGGSSDPAPKTTPKEDPEASRRIVDYDAQARAALAAELDAEFGDEPNTITAGSEPTEGADSDASDEEDDVTEDEPSESDEPADEESADEDEAEEDGDAEEDDEEQEEEAEDDESDEDDDDPEGLPPAAYREVKKYRKRAQAAEKELQALKAEIEPLRTSADTVKAEMETLRAQKVVPAPTAEDPMPDVTDMDKLNAVASTAQAMSDWLEDNPHGGLCPLITDKDGKPVNIPATIENENGETVPNPDFAHIRTRVRADLRAIPGRRQYLEEVAKTDKLLHGTFPELADPKSELSLRLNTVIGNNPELKRRSGYRLGALCYELGRRLIETKGKDALKTIESLKAEAAKPKANKPSKPKGPVKPSAPPALRKPGSVRPKRLKQQNQHPKSKREAASLIDVSDHGF